jgi:glycosidase
MVEKPEKNVIFLDNHDLSRFYGIVEKDMRKFKIGVGLLMTLRGIPQWYYGSEILMSGLSNPDGLVREDFPGGWQEDQVNKFTEEGRSVEENEAFNYLKSLANYRKDSPVLQEGYLMQFTPEPDQYVYFRFMKKRGSVMVVVNTSEETKELKLERYQERLDGFIGGIDVVTGKDSRFDENLKLEPMSIKILELVPVKIEEEKD